MPKDRSADPVERREDSPRRLPSPFEQAGIPVYYAYAIPDQATGPFTDNNDHPLLEAAIISVKWALAQPAKDRFDWSLLDQKISDWTRTGKKIFIRIVPSGQTPGENGDNTDTPTWVYEQGVPRISFRGGGVAKRATVSVPKVWDPRFSPLYEEFLQALGARYNADPRIAGFQLGFGHLGTWNAQPSKDGSQQFQKAGWTLAIWEAHIKRMIELHQQHLTKPLLLTTSRKFLEGVPVTKHFDVAKRIVGYAAERGIAIVMRGLDPEERGFTRSGIPALVTYLGSLNLPREFRMGFTDDWPLWVPPQRSSKCPGSTCGRDVNGFEKVLQYALEAWNSVDRKYPIFFIFLDPEADATNPNNRGKLDQRDQEIFRQEVYDVAVQHLYEEAHGRVDHRSDPAEYP